MHIVTKQLCRAVYSVYKVYTLKYNMLYTVYPSLSLIEPVGGGGAKERFPLLFWVILDSVIINKSCQKLSTVWSNSVTRKSRTFILVNVKFFVFFERELCMLPFT